jgi:hypothetical protein
MTRTATPEVLQQTDLSGRRAKKLEELRQGWGDVSTINEIIAYAYEDWKTVTGGVMGFAHYLTYLLDIEGLLLTAGMMNMMAKMQQEADAQIIRDFFATVPEDSVMGLLTSELAQSILEGKALRTYEG